MAKRWKKEDEAYLKRYAKTTRIERIAERFKTDIETVNAKLEEMGLQAKDSTAQVKVENDPIVKVFERGVKALHNEKWKDAEASFKQVVAESEFQNLAERARQYLKLCVERQATKKAPEDPFLEAVFERNKGNLDKALELCAEGGRHKKDERFAYLAAALHASRGNESKAVEALSSAIDMNPKNRVHAYYDDDFLSLREKTEYKALFEHD